MPGYFKNSILIAIALLIFCTSVKAEDKTDVAKKTFTLNGKISQRIQKYTGLTWLGNQGLGLTTTIISMIIFGGRPKIIFKSESLLDTLSGRFQSVDIDLKNGSFHKIPLPNLHASTTTPVQLNLLRSKKRPAGFVIPVMVTVKGELSEKQITKALQNKTIASSLSFLRLSLPGLGDQHLEVVDPKVELRDSLIYIDTALITSGADKSTGIKLKIKAKPTLRAERFIVLENTQVESPDIIEPEKFAPFIEDLLNPLVDLGRLDHSTYAFRLTELQVAEKRISFTGKLLLAPKPAINKKANAG